MALLALGRWAGLSWAELGLGRDTWRRGLCWALAAKGPPHGPGLTKAEQEQFAELNRPAVRLRQRGRRRMRS